VTQNQTWKPKASDVETCPHKAPHEPFCPWQRLNRIWLVIQELWPPMWWCWGDRTFKRWLGQRIGVVPKGEVSSWRNRWFKISESSLLAHLRPLSPFDFSQMPYEATCHVVTQPGVPHQDTNAMLFEPFSHQKHEPNKFLYFTKHPGSGILLQ
jgi:hypothetical protein